MLVKDYLDVHEVDARSPWSKGSDLFLALALVSIVALMVLPVSSALLDVLVAVNIVFGLILVLMGIYISSPLDFSAFPSVLLVSTLYRLALSVATTRMILLHGDAGNIINAFGGFVAGGNIVVGLVVFLIITIVQFIVIAKGAERVAEVSARFTLDAMPGKQMSIDSDLRSGLIDKDEARRKRNEIELEAKLHGSMDGAMKFVKGDAVAGIVIIIVNLLGGLAIGVLQLDMSISDAMSKYSILTVGDGMVAQIPALLGALSAGLIVTRVNDSSKQTNLGASIQSQIGRVPRASLIAGGLCLFLSLVPGFPSKTFIGIGLLLMTSALMTMTAFKQVIKRYASPLMSSVYPLPNKVRENELLPSQAALPLDFIESTPLQLHIAALHSDDSLADKVSENLSWVQQRLNRELGIVFPEIKIYRRASLELPWLLLVYEVPTAHSKQKDLLDVDTLTQSVYDALRMNATQFFGLQETATLINRVSGANPDLVRELLRLMPMQSLAGVLRNLVSESICIRNIRAVMEALVQAAQSEKDINNLTEHVRVALGRQTVHALAEEGRLSVLMLDQELESHLGNCIRIGNGKMELSIDPKDGERIVSALVDAIEKFRPKALLTNIQVRRCVRMLIERHCFDTVVMSHNEIAHHAQLDVLERISMPPKPALSAV